MWAKKPKLLHTRRTRKDLEILRKNGNIIGYFGLAKVGRPQLPLQKLTKAVETNIIETCVLNHLPIKRKHSKDVGPSTKRSQLDYTDRLVSAELERQVEAHMTKTKIEPHDSIKIPIRTRFQDLLARRRVIS